ncbi:MAG: sensor histidine kinase [Solitalea-like symbiont of Acarus siro]
MNYALRWIIRNTSLKAFVLIVIILLTLLSERYTNCLIKKLAESEKAKVDLFVATTIAKLRTNDVELIRFLYGVVDNYIHIPMIATDSNGSIIGHNGLSKHKTPFIDEVNSKVMYDPDYFLNQLKIMQEQPPPIVYSPSVGSYNYVYYRDSFLLYNLKYFPIIQTFSTLAFLIIAYLLFYASERAEKNLLWVGMAKETAHQLGTPISSIMAWANLLKNNACDNKTIAIELENDAMHLKHISDRFSEIGLNPKLEKYNIYSLIENTINYIQIRTPNNIAYKLNGNKLSSALVNLQLFEWVIENLFKNAINSIGNKAGRITVYIEENRNKIHIYIQDNGSGIYKRYFEKIFKPGFTTKLHGWGLGLSLARRIINVYHKGQIFVYSSVINKGSTFKIILTKVA